MPFQPAQTPHPILEVIGIPLLKLPALAFDCGCRTIAELQAEVDAAVLHLYGLDREQSEWLIDSFTVLRKYEEAAPEKGGHEEFRTKRLALEYYDLMAEAMRTGTSYESPISPPRSGAFA